MEVRYQRFFPDNQLSKIEHSGIPALLRMIADLKVDCPTPEYAFDIHIREKSELMIYHGGTCLLIISFPGVKGEDSDTVLFKSPSYGKGKGCDDKFNLFKGKRDLDDINQLAPYICDFLSKIIASHAVHPKFYSNMKEGYWSSRLSIDYGRNWRPGMGWLIFDREAVLGFEKKDEKSSFYQYKLEAQKIKKILQASDPKKWGTSNSGVPDSMCDFGDELDFLAIGPEKQLQCIELKHASYTSGIYWGPLQASVYLKAYSKEVDNISENIKELVRQKVHLGLLSSEALKLLPEGSFNQVEGILAIADVDKKLKSTCWEKAIEVNEKLDTPIKMLRTNSDGIVWVNSDCW